MKTLALFGLLAAILVAVPLQLASAEMSTGDVEEGYVDVDVSPEGMAVMGSYWYCGDRIHAQWFIADEDKCTPLNPGSMCRLEVDKDVRCIGYEDDMCETPVKGSWNNGAWTSHILCRRNNTAT
ncbi:hypothetical protein BG003_001417 [Podila horticola]|nr:hypothetical protein BG003_001417 [Podila horticola]